MTGGENSDERVFNLSCDLFTKWLVTLSVAKGLPCGWAFSAQPHGDSSLPEFILSSPKGSFTPSRRSFGRMTWSLWRSN